MNWAEEAVEARSLACRACGVNADEVTGHVEGGRAAIWFVRGHIAGCPLEVGRMLVRVGGKTLRSPVARIETPCSQCRPVLDMCGELIGHTYPFSAKCALGGQIGVAEAVNVLGLGNWP